MTLDGNNIQVISTPVQKDITSAKISPQTILKGTPSELDAGFIEAIMAQTESVVSIRSQIADNQAKLAEMQKAIKPAVPASKKPVSAPVVSGNDDHDDESNQNDEFPGGSSGGESNTPAVVASAEEPSIVNLF